MRRIGCFLAITITAAVLADSARADMVTDWNIYTELAIRTAGAGPPAQGRTLAMVHGAIYDAVNGIAQKYTPYRVTDPAPRGATQEAAAAQAAYTVLLALFPSQQAVLDAQLEDSIDSLHGKQGGRKGIERGRLWGTQVAEQILAWRANDGFSGSPGSYLGGGAPGVWRSPPTATDADGTLPAVFGQIATLAPFAMTSPGQFRPGPPPALTSAEYAADVNEVKAIGGVASTTRTEEQTQAARLWAAVGPVDENHAIRGLVPRHFRLVDRARLFALINIAAADATIAGFDSKVAYNLWRPYHAIRLADTDDNPDTEADGTWESLVPAPRFQEYMSNHAVITTAFMSTLAQLLGDDHEFTLDAPGYPSFHRTFTRLSDAAADVLEARIWGGIHFRNSCDVGAEQGLKISDHVVDTLMLPR